MKDTWLLFIMDFRLTASEIYQAHKLAIQRKLLDSYGNEIECLPMLSTNTTGKILRAYELMKQNDKQLEEGREKLKKILYPEPELTEEQKKEIRKKNWETMIDSVRNGEECKHAFLFYEFAIKKGGFKEFLNNSEIQKIAIQDKMIQILGKEKLKQNSGLFKVYELNKLTSFFESDKKVLPEDIVFSFDRLQAMAITEVKNDKVYEWVSEQIKNRSDTKSD